MFIWCLFMIECVFYVIGWNTALLLLCPLYSIPSGAHAAHVFGDLIWPLGQPVVHFLHFIITTFCPFQLVNCLWGDIKTKHISCTSSQFCPRFSIYWRVLLDSVFALRVTKIDYFQTPALLPHLQSMLSILLQARTLLLSPFFLFFNWSFFSFLFFFCLPPFLFFFLL